MARDDLSGVVEGSNAGDLDASEKRQYGIKEVSSSQAVKATSPKADPSMASI
jgi:hypothetical protein